MSGLETRTVLAAGGVVRRRVQGRAEFAVVHRPKYGDWSLPKGKLLPDETHEQAALREVAEETGIQGELAIELPSTAYADARGRPKRVRYWLMRVVREVPFTADAEIDDMRWASPDEARRLLTYPRDRQILDAALALDAPCYLVRHAKAAERRRWEGDDRLRPLTSTGRRQAEALVGLLADGGICSIVTSPFVRCVETIRPLAEALGLPVRKTDALAEGAPFEDTAALLRSVPGPAVVCAHGDLVPQVVRIAGEEGADVDPSGGWKKGSIWILERDAGSPIRARYLPPPT